MEEYEVVATHFWETNLGLPKDSENRWECDSLASAIRLIWRKFPAAQEGYADGAEVRLFCDDSIDGVETEIKIWKIC